MQSSHKVHYSVSLFGTKLASRQIDNRARQSSYICIKSRLTLGLVFFPSLMDREDAISSKFTLDERDRVIRANSSWITGREYSSKCEISSDVSVQKEREGEREREREREKGKGRGRKEEGERGKKREREI